MIEYAIGAAVGSALTLLWVQGRKRFVWPLKGDEFWLDGRLVVFLETDRNACGPFHAEVWFKANRRRQKCGWLYWCRRARPAASNPGKLLEIKARG